MKIDKLKEIVLILVAVILCIFLIKYLSLFKYLGILFNILIPVFIGFIYAWVVNPIVRKLSKKINRNIVCILLFLLILFLFGLFIYYLVPMFYKELMEFIKILPDYISKIEISVEEFGLRDIKSKLITFIVDSLPMYVVNIVKGLFKYIGVILVGLILGLYMSIDYEKIVKNIYKIVPKKYKCVLVNLTIEASEEVRKCVNGTLLVALFVLVLDSIGFMVIGLDNYLLLGIVCGITDLIPYVGPYIGGAIAVLVGFTESKSLGIMTLLICFIVQSIENYLLQPIIMSKTIKISPIVVMIGLIVFGRLFGILGMIISAPLLALLKVVIVYIEPVLKKCRKKRT